MDAVIPGNCESMMTFTIIYFSLVTTTVHSAPYSVALLSDDDSLATTCSGSIFSDFFTVERPTQPVDKETTHGVDGRHKCNVRDVTEGRQSVVRSAQLEAEKCETIFCALLYR